ncbi:hypothetical protein RB597_001151 [Gaeumannomyces tritici]
MAGIGVLPAAHLAALGDDASVSMGWIEMVMPKDDQGEAVSNAYAMRVVEEPANKFVRMIKEPLNLISVMGPARSGKSTLMNLLAGCTTTELFATYPGMETFTKGVYVPTRVVTLPQFSSLEGEPVVEAANSAIKVSFVDTEGQGAVGDVYDMNLFSPALVTSRVVIYNRTGGLLTEEILGQLGMMTQAAKRLQTADAAAAAKGPIFGHLFIIFNQFRLNVNDTADSLRDKLMAEEKNPDAVGTTRNNIRKLLALTFESIKVCILPDRLKSDARDALSDGTKKFLLLSDFEPKYLEYFKVLRNALSRALVTPRELTKGTPLTGGAIADFMPSFADAINKQEPLNLPSIFEAAQNEAVNKAQVEFTNSLTASVASRLQDEAKPTQMLSSFFDTDVSILLTQLAKTLSYMPPDVIQKAQGQASQSAEPTRKNLLDTNLSRVRALLASALTAAIKSIPAQIQAAFPADNVRASPTDIDSRLGAISTKLAAELKAKGDTFDPSCLPDKYADAIRQAVDIQRTSINERAGTAWAVWAADVNKSLMTTLLGGLAGLTTTTKVGESKVYTKKAAALVDTAKADFTRRLDAEYAWADRDAQKLQFTAAAEAAAKTQQALWEANDDEVRGALAALASRLQASYQIQLQDSLQPKIEPPSYSAITDPSPIRARLAEFCTTNKVSDTVTSDALFQFDSFVSGKKADFNNVYSKACSDYSNDLDKALSMQVPLVIDVYNRGLDSIDLELTSASTTRASIETKCNAVGTEAANSFKVVISGYNTIPGGAVSKPIVDTRTLQLTNSLAEGKAAKLSKYDEVVSVWNKALLTSIVVPIVDSALANKFANEVALAREVDAREADYMNRKRGDGDDARQKWKIFKTTTYLALVETVRRFDAYNIPGLEANLAATKEIQEKVISRITAPCATIASCLGMSWIGGGYDFYGGNPSALLPPQDLGLPQADPQKGQPGQNMRMFRMNNQGEPPSDGYRRDERTNLEFYEWAVEISDIIWGKPIVTDIKPVKVDTTEYGAQSTPLEVTVGTVSTETSTITDSQTWGISAGVEVGYKSGVKDVWEANVKGTFNAKFDSTHSSQVATTFTTSTSAKLVLPPNRISCINQLIFNQRTSLSYTAKVRVVPRLRFQNGFTAWGGGGNYRDNPNTNARKSGMGAGERRTDRLDFRRCDEIREDARANADPWEWQLCMERNPDLTSALDTLASGTPFEVYVKGKWEGITGKYAVTTVTPKSTTLTLLPMDM